MLSIEPTAEGIRIGTAHHSIEYAQKLLTRWSRHARNTYRYRGAEDAHAYHTRKCELLAVAIAKAGLPQPTSTPAPPPIEEQTIARPAPRRRNLRLRS